MYISTSTQGRSSVQTRKYVTCSLVCESGAEVELWENVAKYPGSE